MLVSPGLGKQRQEELCGSLTNELSQIRQTQSPSEGPHLKIKQGDDHPEDQHLRLTSGFQVHTHICTHRWTVGLWEKKMFTNAEKAPSLQGRSNDCFSLLETSCGTLK